MFVTQVEDGAKENTVACGNKRNTDQWAPTKHHNNGFFFPIQGGPETNGTAYFPQYVDAITDTSVWGNLIPRSLISDQ